jgi:hypothetical protein
MRAGFFRHFIHAMTRLAAYAGLQHIEPSRDSPSPGRALTPHPLHITGG